MFKTWQHNKMHLYSEIPTSTKHTISMLNIHNTHAFCPQTLRYTQIPTCCSVNSPSGRHCCWFDLENTYHPNPVVTDRCFRDRGAVLNTYKPPKRQTRNHHTWGHHMSQCTRQTPPTLLYSNEQLWMLWQHWYGRWLCWQYKCIDWTHISQPFI